MKTFTKRSLLAIVASSALIGSFALAGTAMAAAIPGGFGARGGVNMPRPAIVGTVASISGNTFTVNSKSFQRKSATTTSSTSVTYTVNAANATVTKNGAVSTVSAIAVGDTVMVQGTVSGTSVTATKINDGTMGRSETSGDKPKMGNASSTPPFVGNGQPVIGGSVTTINGNSLTVTNKGNVTYTVNVSSAKIVKGGVANATISNIVVGDTVVIQGTVNGASVTASSVTDQGTRPNESENSASTTPEHRGGGFFNAIGGFFSRIFGFF